jgi:hypothetical protein
MQKDKTPIKSPEIIRPEKIVEVPKPIDPSEPLIPDEDPNTIPEEEPFETPPFEVPPPAEEPK